MGSTFSSEVGKKEQPDKDHDESRCDTELCESLHHFFLFAASTAALPSSSGICIPSSIRSKYACDILIFPFLRAVATTCLSDFAFVIKLAALNGLEPL